MGSRIPDRLHGITHDHPSGDTAPAAGHPTSHRRPHQRRATLPVAASSMALLAGLLAGLAAGPAAAAPSEPTKPRLTLAQVQSRVDALNHQAEQAAERFNDARVQLAAVQTQLGRVKARLAAQQQRVRKASDLLGNFAAARYRASGLDPTVQLVLADDPDAFLRQAAAVSELSRQQAQALTQVTSARQRLAADQAVVADRLTRRRELKATLAAEKADVEAKLARANDLLNQLKAAQRAQLERARLAAAEQARAQAGAARALAQAAVSRDSERNGFGASSSAAGSGGSSGAGGAAAAVAFAYAQLGEPYRWGGAGPGSWDCSGLTMMAWRAAGKSLSHSASAQASATRSVPRSDLRPGDLVFFYSPISHVGIYIGGGKMIDAPHPGATVRIVSISTMPFAGAGRP